MAIGWANGWGNLQHPQNKQFGGKAAQNRSSKQKPSHPRNQRSDAMGAGLGEEYTLTQRGDGCLEDAAAKPAVAQRAGGIFNAILRTFSGGMVGI